ncbi:MAG: copper oxidase [Sporichthyaceae bacterium]
MSSGMSRSSTGTAVRRATAVAAAVAMSMLGSAGVAYASADQNTTDLSAKAITGRDSGISAPGSTTIGFDPPVGLGPRPISFAQTDAQGSWFDTGTAIVGTHSLAVAVQPSLVGAASYKGAPQAGRIVGSGMLTGDELRATLNEDLPGLRGKHVRGKTLGQLGYDVDKMLNLDLVRSTVAQLLPVKDVRIAQIDNLTKAFAAEAANLPADQPIALNKSKTGAEMMAVLKGIRAAAPLLPVTVNFNVGQPGTGQAHTSTALIWPEGASGMPFDQTGAYIGSRAVELTKPGLYAFACKVHPYMLGAVVVDDPLTPGPDFAPKLVIKSRGMTVPSYSSIITQLAQKFFVITNPENWQKFSDSGDVTWDPKFAPAPILMYDKSGNPQLVPNLEQRIRDEFALPKTLEKSGVKPSTAGIGKVYFNTQMEKYAGKEKSGAITVLDAETWEIERKIAAPEINMNNPHNMWTDKKEKFIYQTEWFGNMLNVFDRSSGKLIRRIEVGPSPTHVMTRTDTDQLHVALGGGGAVIELSPGATKIDRRIKVGSAGEKIAHPHAHWMSGNAKWMAAPNVNLYNASLVDIPKGTFVHKKTGEFPIATGMDARGDRTYMANFLGASFTCFSNAKAACNDNGKKVANKEVDLWTNYDPVSGVGGGGFGGLPIQVAISPNDVGGIIANTFSSQLGIIDPDTDEIAAWLPCDAGCHGVNFGAKKGGGYYGYITNKFSNQLLVVDIDPNADGNPVDAAIVGRLLTDATSSTATDDAISELSGMGGQGVMTVPLAYAGWVERVPMNKTNKQLTCEQRFPLAFKKKC